MQFTPDGYTFKLQGENYDSDGVSINAFRAELSSLAWPIANFQHFNSDTRSKKDPFEGLGVVTFEEARPHPIKYTAHYSHNTSADSFSSIARRLTDTKERALLCHQKTLREFVIREWHRFADFLRFLAVADCRVERVGGIGGQSSNLDSSLEFLCRGFPGLFNTKPIHDS